MFRSYQRFSVLLVAISVITLFAERAVAFDVKISLYPNRTNITLDEVDRISVVADVTSDDRNFLNYKWSLEGPGRIDGIPTEPAIMYMPPDKIDGKSAEAIITVTVSDTKGQEVSKSITFTILTPPPIVTIVVFPNMTEVRVGSALISLAAQASGLNLTYKWELLGPGKLEGSIEGSAIFYRPPDRIEGKSAKAIITVTVSNTNGQEVSTSVPFTIITPTPPTIVSIEINPPFSKFRTGTGQIALKVFVTGKEPLQYKWKLEGPGVFMGPIDRSAVAYIPPEEIEGKSTEAVITVTVTDSTGAKATKSKTFTIISDTVLIANKTELTKQLIVKITGENTIGAGIVFSLDDDFIFIATANHVVRKRMDEARNLQVEFKFLPGDPIKAKLLNKSDTGFDLAVLRVNLHESEIPRDKWDDWLPFDQINYISDLKENVKEADDVYPVGHPLGYDWDSPVTPSKVKKIIGESIHFETDGCYPGQSGGGLFSDRRDMIGMIKGKIGPYCEAISFARIYETLKYDWGLKVSLKSVTDE